MNAVYLRNPLRPLNGITLTRGDDAELSVSIVEPGQTGATLKLTAMLASEFPNGTPRISKSGSDFTIQVDGNTLSGTVSLNSIETVFVLERSKFVYDLERTVGGKKKTIEKGEFFVDPDVTP